MAESYTPRMGVRRWTDNGDTFTRDELDQSFVNIEARAAIFGNGALSARPAPAVQGRFYLLDSTEPNAALRGQLYYDTGTAWVMVKFDLTAILAAKAEVSHSHDINDLPVAGNGVSSTTLLVRADDARLASEWVAGDILWSAATARPGFSLCDGGVLNTTTEAALFAKIGYKWGGSGSNFNKPDLRDRFPIGASADKALGATGGNASKTITSGHLPQHTHTMSSAGNHSHGGATGVGSGTYYGVPTGVLDGTGWMLSTSPGGYVNRVLVAGDGFPTAVHTHVISSDGTHQHVINNTGVSNPALDVMNPWLALNPFIKL